MFFSSYKQAQEQFFIFYSTFFSDFDVVSQLFS